ncbi:hypothetical protein ABBQ38_002659 [Trebouxia sp. C0009 RCD-2024]
MTPMCAVRPKPLLICAGHKALCASHTRAKQSTTPNGMYAFSQSRHSTVYIHHVAHMGHVNTYSMQACCQKARHIASTTLKRISKVVQTDSAVGTRTPKAEQPNHSKTA